MSDISEQLEELNDEADAQEGRDDFTGAADTWERIARLHVGEADDDLGLDEVEQADELCAAAAAYRHAADDLELASAKVAATDPREAARLQAEANADLERAAKLFEKCAGRRFERGDFDRAREAYVNSHTTWLRLRSSAAATQKHYEQQRDADSNDDDEVERDRKAADEARKEKEAANGGIPRTEKAEKAARDAIDEAAKSDDGR